MKKIVSIIVACILISVSFAEEQWISFIDIEDEISIEDNYDFDGDYQGEELQDIIPSNGLWGMTKEELKQILNDSIDCRVAKHEALLKKNQNINLYNMDVYYVFGNDFGSDQGLSKIAYILSDNEMSKDDRNECRQSFENSIKQKYGEPISAADAVTTWNIANVKVEIGTGKFKKYKGTESPSVGVILTCVTSIDARVTKENNGNNQGNVIEIINQSEKSLMPYLLLSKDEYRKLSFYWTKEEKKAAIEYLGTYIKEKYDNAFVSKSKRTKNRTFLLFGFDTKMVFEFDVKYFTNKFGTIVGGNLSSGLIVQYDDLSHTVTYVLRDKKLNIIDYKTNEEFYTDFSLSSRNTVIDAIYPQ